MDPKEEALREALMLLGFRRIRCTFIPQAWVNDYAVEAEPEGLTTWTAVVAQLPEPQSYESDELRFTPQAPQWIQEWGGPFEVVYEEI